MASGSNVRDVSEQFQKMAEKLGWFKHGDLDGALKSLSKSSKKKKITKPKNTDDENRKDVKHPLMSKKTNTKKPKALLKKPVSNSFMKTDLDRFLSSDSDSSFTTVSETLSKNDPKTKVIQVCSDSEGEERPKEDTYISCIGESALCISDSDGENKQLDDAHRHRLDRYTFDSNESIMRNRVSLTSLSMDENSIGEPLVESTRIHRRSSVTYKQLMGSPEEEDSGSMTASASGNLCHQVENLHVGTAKRQSLNFDLDPDVIGESPEVSPVKDLRYVTALENFDDLETTQVGDKLPYDGESSSKADIGSCSSNEYVEVIDTATQTSYSGNDVHDEADETQHKPVSQIYGDETLNSIAYAGKRCKTNSTDHADGNNELVEADVKSGHVYMSTTTSCDPLDAAYDQSTISNPALSKLSETNESVDMNSVYSRITVERTRNKDTSRQIIDLSDYEGESMVHDETTEDLTGTKLVSDHENDAYSQITVDVSNIGLGESHEYPSDKISDSDNSVYEVTDVATQTEGTGQPSNDASNEDGSHEVERELTNKYETACSINSDGISDEDNIHNENEVDETSSSLPSKSEDSSVKEDSKKDSSSYIQTKGKPKQKASHFFELSSDSDAELEANEKDNSVSTSSNASHRSPDKGTVDQESDVDSYEDNKGASKTDSDGIDSGNSLEVYNKGKEDRNIIRVPGEDENDGQSWRDSRRFDSESSDDDNLEAFFQKMRKPEKKKSLVSSDSSPEKMDSFIVEDDEMSSESNDEEFYLRENQKLERKPLTERLKSSRGSSQNYSESEESSDDVFSSKLYPRSVTKHKEKKKAQSQRGVKSHSLYWESSDSEDNNRKITNGSKGKNGTESFNTKTNISSNSDTKSPLFKTPKPIRRHKTTSSESFDGKDETNKFKTPVIKPRSVTSLAEYFSLSDADSTDDDDSLPSLSTSTALPSLSTSTANKENVPNNQTPVKTKSQDYSDVFLKMPTPLSKLKTPRGSDSRKGSYSCSFLQSLSNTTEDLKRDPEAAKFVKNFKKTREDLVKHLFNFYNISIFEKKLPTDLEIIWNKRLLKTAGFCAYRCKRTNKEDRTARIELSTKVCDSPERVRDTLIHELCHAAVWLLNGVNGGHGNFWRYWARLASKIHPELPTISRCHSYSINTKFTYKCTRCGYSIGRHSKSLDTTKKICGYCKGTFALIQNATPMTPQSASSSVGATPRTPNRFAMFVKDNYNAVKQKNKDLKHGDVMKELSRKFAASKINT